MEVEKPPLALGESANVDDALRLDTHAPEGGLVCHRGDDEGVRIADDADTVGATGLRPDR